MCLLCLARRNLFTALLHLKEKKKKKKARDGFSWNTVASLQPSSMTVSFLVSACLCFTQQEVEEESVSVFGISLNQLRGSDCDQGPRFPVGICFVSLKFFPLKPESYKNPVANIYWLYIIYQVNTLYTSAHLICTSLIFKSYYYHDFADKKMR